MTLFLDALACKNDYGRPPVWMMRQAGRYAPSYQAIKKEHSLNQMFRSADLIEKVTLLPMQDLDPDAAIIFADILHVPLTMGFDVDFPASGGIDISPLIENKEDFERRDICQDPKKVLHYVFEGIQRVKTRIDKPLLGFAGGPFTVASYLFKERAIKKWMVKEPGRVHDLLQTISDQTVRYLKEQEKAGVDAVQIFESWASLLTYQEFQEFAYPYLKQILDALSVPSVFFARQTHNFLDQIIQLNPSAISFDDFLPIEVLDQKVPSHIAIQGNLNPYMLYGSCEKVEKETIKMLKAMSGSSRYIVNLGHGIMHDTPFENAQLFIKTVTQFSPSYL